jgi:hypothetical protein
MNVVAIRKRLLDCASKAAYTLVNQARLAFFFKVRRGAVRVSTLRKPPNFISQYYEYCVNGILGALDGKSNGKLSICLMGQNFIFGTNDKSVEINTEHTLVRRNGRGSEGSPIGDIPVIGEGSSENYLVRIPGGTRVRPDSTQIIEYSVPNLINVHQSELREVYSGKSHYIAPLLSPRMVNPSPQSRDVSKAFTFMSLPEGGDRRTEIIEGLSRSGIQTANIQGLVGDANEAMSRVGVLLNLHQTDHHHTLEELRILPALLQGVLVLSEPSPLIAEVPYSKFVTFATIQDMPDLLSDLLANHERIWDETFNSGAFNEVISGMDRSNKRAFAEIVQNLGF